MSSLSEKSYTEPVDESVKPMSADHELDSTTEQPIIKPRDFRFGLIELLSKIETLRQQLYGTRLNVDAEHILDRMEAMVLLAEEFGKTQEFDESDLEPQMTAMAKAGEFYSTLNDCRDKVPRSLLKSMISKISSTDDRLSKANVIECMQVGLEAMNAYFSLFTRMFQSSTKARGWVDAASAFLADFRLLVRMMQAESAAAE